MPRRFIASQIRPQASMAQNIISTPFFGKSESFAIISFGKFQGAICRSLSPEKFPLC